jgi:mRNA interferase MazF
VAQEVARGQIWMLRLGPRDKRRPVVVLSRPTLIELLHTVTVVAITSTGHGSPTEVALGIDEGLKKPSFANLVNVFTVPKSCLHRFVGTLGQAKMRAVCEALAIAVGCE